MGAWALYVKNKHSILTCDNCLLYTDFVIKNIGDKIDDTKVDANRIIALPNFNCFIIKQTIPLPVVIYNRWDYY